MTLQPADLDRLEQLAREATPGPWAQSVVAGDILTVYHYTAGAAIAWVNGENETGIHHPAADAAYIAALSPTTVLALVAAAHPEAGSANG